MPQDHDTTDAVTITVATPQGRLAALKSGSGPALVIVHGVGGHKEDWAEVAAALSDMRTVYAVDMLGFGASDKSVAEITVPGQAAAIAALLDTEGHGQADIVGNSVGGWVAATFAADFPDRTRRVALIDPAGFRAMFEGAPPVNFYPADESEMATLLAHVIHDPAAHTPERVAAAFAAFQASGDAATGERIFAGLFGSPRLEDVLPRIAAPTRMIWGQEDRLFPVALLPYLTAIVPGATGVAIEGASHFVQIDRAEALIAELRAHLI